MKRGGMLKHSLFSLCFPKHWRLREMRLAFRELAADPGSYAPSREFPLMPYEAFGYNLRTPSDAATLIDIARVVFYGARVHHQRNEEYNWLESQLSPDYQDVLSVRVNAKWFHLSAHHLNASLLAGVTIGFPRDYELKLNGLNDGCRYDDVDAAIHFPKMRELAASVVAPNGAHRETLRKAEQNKMVWAL